MAPPDTVILAAEDPAIPFPPRMMDVMADLSAVLFRRELGTDGAIRYSWLSDNIRDVLGFSAAEITLTPKGALNAVHWADRDSHVASIHRSASDLGHCRERFRAVSAAGETRWFLGSSIPAQLPDGRIVWDGAWIDISPWMRAEYQFQTVMDHAEDVVLMLDSSAAIDWANAAAERLFGWSAEELPGLGLADLLADPHDALPPGGAAEGFLPGTQEVVARRKDGRRFPFEMTVSEVRSDGRLSLIVIGRDITRRKATEQMLEETERRLRSMAANLPGVVFQRALGPDGTFTYPYVSDGIEEILGCGAMDIVADASLLFDAMVDADRDRLLTDLLRSAERLEPVDEDVRVRTGHGSLRWLSGQSRPRRRGDAIVWDGLLLDVTEEVEERIAAEKAIRDSEERFRQVFAAASLGIVVVAKDGTIRQHNPAFATMCGGIALEAASFHGFVAREHLPDPERSPPDEDFCFEYQPHLPDGLERHWRVTGSRFSANRDDETPSLLFLIEDITEIIRAGEERRQLELVLTEGQKLEALGRLAGGVAHELNNMLGPILMAAEMITRTGALDAKNGERCHRIIEAAKHGRDIVRNVLAYCRKETKALAPLDLVPVFTHFVALAASILPSSVRVETRVDPEQAPVVGDAGQLTQVLLNLVNNARDAMDGQGTLRLELLRVAPGDLAPRRPAREHRPRRPGEAPRDQAQPNPFTALDATRAHVEIRVADTGCGMRPGTVAKIFDPFFTTKPVGQGTGLGLSVVQGIVKAMGGAIAVDSRLGEGTAFRIVLPVIPAA